MEAGHRGLSGVHARKVVMEEKKRDTDHAQTHILLDLADNA